MDAETLQVYQKRAKDFCSHYRTQQPNRLYNTVRSFFHPGADTADIGCGSGRDVAWLAQKGFRTTGFDASTEMLSNAATNYPELSFQSSSLPNLAGIAPTTFENILCSAVLMHLPTESLITAFINIARVLRPNGRLIITYRAGANGVEREVDGRLFTKIPRGKLSLLLESVGLRVVLIEDQSDTYRPELSWTVILAEKGPLNHARGLERVQSVLVQDVKTATYKLALIRAFCHISRTQSHTVTWSDNQVLIPIRTVAIRWFVYYWPLFASNEFIAQTRGEAPECAKPVAFRADVRELQQIYGTGALSSLLRDIEQGDNKCDSCLRKIAHAIKVGPVKFTGTMSDPVFNFVAPTAQQRKFADAWGWILVPETIWLDICRFDHWIEDSVVMRWAELSAEMNAAHSVHQIIPFLLSKPTDERDTSDIRSLILHAHEPLHCVWSGIPLVGDAIHVDHAIPFSVWGNNDYWNLLPCNDTVNLNKRASVPSQLLIEERSDCIVSYWRWYGESFPARFDYQISNAFGCERTSRNWELAALAGFKESVQRITSTRGVATWHP